MTLDASAYPHILDSVLALSDRCALLALRGASRSLRDWVDERLAEHVKLHIPIGGLHAHNPGPKLDIKLLRERMRRLEVTGAGGRLPAFMGWAGAIAPVRRRDPPQAAPDASPSAAFESLDEELHDRVSSTPAEEDANEVEAQIARRAARKAVRACCAASLAHAMTVDITCLPRTWLEDGAPDLLRVLKAHTYRFHKPWCSWDARPFNAASAVVFTPMVLGRAEWVIPVPYSTFKGPRLVLNLTGFHCPDLVESMSFPPTADALQVVSVAEVVINLAALAQAHAQRKDKPGLLFPTSRVIFRNPTTKFTLVGACDVDPASFGVAVQDADEIRRAVVNVVNQLRSWYPNYWTPEIMESLPDRIRMLSLNEYREELGVERFALEAVP